MIGRTRLGKKKPGSGGSSGASAPSTKKLRKSRTTSALSGQLPHPPALPYYNYDTWSVISDRTHLHHDPYAIPKKSESQVRMNRRKKPVLAMIFNPKTFCFFFN